MRRRVAVVTVLALLAALAVVLVGWPRWRGSSPSAGTEGQSPWQKTALWVQEQGKPAQPFENGRAVTVGNVNVEVFVAPYPPVREGSIDLYVRDKATGAPVEGGGLEILFDMYMPHGSIRAEAQPMGGGHHLVPYKLVMPGEWRVDLTITHRDDVAALTLIFRVN